MFHYCPWMRAIQRKKVHQLPPAQPLKKHRENIRASLGSPSRSSSGPETDACGFGHLSPTNGFLDLQY